MISVCIATYNGERYIREQIKSILSQLSEADEIVISDDGSIDNTIDLIISFADKRIKIFKNDGQHGVVPNFENAIIHSAGDLIFLSDQDDIWDPQKVQKCIKAIEDVDLVVHNSLIMDGNGFISDKDFFSIRKSGSGYWKNLYKNSFVGSCMVFKVSLKKYILPFPPNILWHDMWIGLIAEKVGKTKFIEDTLLYYRRHEHNASATSEKSTFGLKFKLIYRWNMLINSLFPKCN